MISETHLDHSALQIVQQGALWNGLDGRDLLERPAPYSGDKGPSAEDYPGHQQAQEQEGHNRSDVPRRHLVQSCNVGNGALTPPKLRVVFFTILQVDTDLDQAERQLQRESRGRRQFTFPPQSKKHAEVSLEIPPRSPKTHFPLRVAGLQRKLSDLFIHRFRPAVVANQTLRVGRALLVGKK